MTYKISKPKLKEKQDDLFKAPNIDEDKKKLEEQLNIHIKDSNEWIEFTENDYDKLSNIDKMLFEQN